MLRSTLFVALAAASISPFATSLAGDATLVLEQESAVDDSGPSDPLQRAKVNAAPCGRDTIAVVHTDSGDTYAFCAFDGGLSTMEVLASGDASTSRIDRHPTPLALFNAVIPKGVAVPPQIAQAIASGHGIGADAKHGVPFTVGTAPMPRAQVPAAKGVCAAPALNTNGFDARDEFFGDFTFCGLVNTQSASSNNTDWHQQTASNTFDAGGNEGSHNHAGPHYDYGDGVITYYADEDEDGGARFGRALVHSCSGETRFRGWLKASPTTGSWGDPNVEYYVPSGELYVMRLYANAQHSLWMGYDADDIRFRADAVNGSSFGSRMYFAKYGWGTQCDINY